MVPKIVLELAFEIVSAKNASQKPCKDFYLQQNCKNNKNTGSINKTPILFLHSTSASTANTTANITDNTTYNDKLA